MNIWKVDRVMKERCEYSNSRYLALVDAKPNFFEFIDIMLFTEGLAATLTMQISSFDS